MLVGFSCNWVGSSRDAFAFLRYSTGMRSVSGLLREMMAVRLWTEMEVGMELREMENGVVGFILLVVMMVMIDS